MNRQSLIQLTAAAALLGASFASQAAEPVGTRIVTGVGQWIAAQGNAALREIREDIREDLADSLKPLLPTAPEPQQPVPGHDENDVAAR